MIKRLISLMAVLVISFSGAVLAEDALLQPEAPPKVDHTATQATDPDASQPAVQTAADTSIKPVEPTITVTLFDNDLRETLKEFSLQTGVNIIADENVRGTVTMELKAVPLEKALRMVLISGGFSYRKIDDFYVVGLADPKNPVFKELAETEIYKFKNIRADTARILLPSVFQQYAQFDVVTNQATVAGPRTIVERVLGDLKKMDLPKPQVRIKALITDVNSEIVKNWGMDVFNWTVLNGQTLNNKWTASLSFTPGGLSIDTDMFGKIVNQIKALEQERKAKIHADPTIVVADGRTGEFYVGDKKSVEMGKDADGDSIRQYIDYGTTMKVTPQVFDDHITLDIVEKVSSLTSETQGGQIRSAEITSSISLLPGQAALIGGLTRNDSFTDSSKTPILGNIPILRFLFKRENDKQADSELLLFITAEVVK